ncbi:hypothetical protein ASE41_17940 [Streptomyces sp. Root264]|nr:hypothetical protein ASE41_17940 [Streptomyces sp. Root264]
MADPAVRTAVAFSRHVTHETRDRLLALVEAEKAAGRVDAWVALDWSFREPEPAAVFVARPNPVRLPVA